MSERAYVREVGLRDGLQSLAEIMPTEQKIAWLDADDVTLDYLDYDWSLNEKRKP